MAAGHPRVGGGHWPSALAFSSSRGSSPRGRGTLEPDPEAQRNGRVIPAWAGNTSRARTYRHMPTGHPRVGGEHTVTNTNQNLSTGSSPRGRGTLGVDGVPFVIARVIPAWAGNTSAIIETPPDVAGHPRVGGEHINSSHRDVSQSGSSPRGRGTRYLRILKSFRASGHPRVGGEHASMAVTRLPGSGSSPRGRGTHGDRDRNYRHRRVIPAWAGNTSFRAPHCCLYSGHPRVGGEHVNPAIPSRGRYGSSPRGRGTPESARLAALDGRVIPAWAGNTFASSRWPVSRPGHPRVGGEHGAAAPAK